MSRPSLVVAVADESYYDRSTMRWLAVWLLLTGVYFAGQLVTPLLTGGGWRYSRESLAHLAIVPLIQVVSLRVVALVRRDRRRRRPAGPPEAPPE